MQRGIIIIFRNDVITPLDRVCTVYSQALTEALLQKSWIHLLYIDTDRWLQFSVITVANLAKHTREKVFLEFPRERVKNRC